MPIDFADIAVETPTRERLAARYRAIEAAFGEGTMAARAEALTAWDRLRREVKSWAAMTWIRVQQDTKDPKAKADQEHADGMLPEAADFETRFMRRLLADPDRAGLVKLVGTHAVRLWEAEITTFEPGIATDLEREAGLASRHSKILAGAEIGIGGIEVNLAGLGPFAQDLDRETRHQAEKLRWEFFAAQGETLDSLYGELVRLRHGMAKKLGYASYIELGYRRMQRVDYGPEDVARYRDQIALHVVPLVGRLLERRRRDFGYEKLYYWDEAITDRLGNPKPAGDHDFLIARAEILFDRMDKRLGDFYRMMRDGGFLDLRNRPDKAGGAFCTAFPAYGVPFIFANFNGTDLDVTAFIHEIGHAFQNWQSRHQPGVDYLWPTTESAEIHSMSLEFLSHPQLGLLFGEAEAERARHAHLIWWLSFLPDTVCADHFQHMVYAHPDATPADRHEMWRGLEQHYMPWRDYGDLAYPAKGAMWQAKGLIYLAPFYNIDYTLAASCALQLWLKSLEDYPKAMETYVALCGRGGSAPFQELVRSADLVSPFAPGCLAGIVAEAERRLAA
jgi:M3 family oligoendopeptidase